MSRILLVDDSPHAQRIGERILSEEGYEVVTVSNADSALIRLEDVDPDLVLADTVMPGRTGYELCQYLKMSPRHQRVRVILTAGVLEDFDAELLKRVQADATLKKPFEASALLAAVKPLAEAAEKERDQGSGARDQGAQAPPAAAVPFVAVVDAEQVRAAVTLALDAAMEAIVSEVTARVLTALESISPAASAAVAASTAAAPAASTGSQAKPPASQSGPLPEPAAPAPGAPTPVLETVRRVNTIRVRPASILGLDLDPDFPGSDSRSNSK
ncbi:MAG TPA: response regulator [Bryobacteraceae bacterium]|nr:response regulator [Bryobacteraceae bacterium]